MTAARRRPLVHVDARADQAMKTLSVLLLVLAVLPLLLLAAGQAGLLKGSMPADLGVRDGRLKPPSATPNSVSSQAGLYEGAGASYAQIEPILYRGDGAAALTRIGAIVLKMPGARIMSSAPDYLYVQFQTKWLKFVDDCEFLVLPDARGGDFGAIHLRSASRIGRKDFGTNRARIEAIRAQFNA